MQNKNSGRPKLVLATLEGKETEDYSLQNLLTSISRVESFLASKAVPVREFTANKLLEQKPTLSRKKSVKKKSIFRHIFVGSLAVSALASCVPAIIGFNTGYDASEDKNAAVAMYRDSVEDREAKIYVSKFDRYGDSANWRECRRKAEHMTIKQNNQAEAGKDILFWCEKGIPDYVQSAIRASVDPYIAIDPEAYITNK